MEEESWPAVLCGPFELTRVVVAAWDEFHTKRRPTTLPALNASLATPPCSPSHSASLAKTAMPRSSPFARLSCLDSSLKSCRRTIQTGHRCVAAL